MKEAILQLSLFDIITICIAIISVFFNLYQFMDSRKFKQQLLNPIHSQLVGLFNDIKSKLGTTYITQQLLSNPKNPHKDLDTLKWEYYLFTFAVLGFLNGFQEIARAALSTLKPEDKIGEAAFRAADYGLTQEERKLRDELVKQYTTQPANITQTQDQTEEKEKT